MTSITANRQALIVWVASYVFFLLSLVNNFSAAHDSVNYLDNIVKGEHLFHQHHLLYHFLAHYWMKMVTGIFPNVPVHYAIESFTALWGSSILTTAWLFFRNRFNLKPAIAVPGVMLIAFSYGVWFYSTNIEVYAPPLFFILAALYVLTGNTWNNRTITKLAVLHSLAVLFHQVNILFAVVVLFVIIGNKKDVLRSLLQYAAISIVITGGMYFLTGWVILGNNTPGEWISWMEGYTVGHDYWQPLSIKTPLHVATGFSHAFIGGHFIFQLPILKQTFQQSFQGHGLSDEIFLSSDISGGLAWMLTALSLIIGLMLLIMMIRFIRRYNMLRRQWPRVLPPLLLCLLVYSLFFCFWMPEILEFWILQMVLVWVILTGTLPAAGLPFKFSSRTWLTALMLMLFIVNYAGSMKWLKDIRKDWYYAEVQRVKGPVRQGDLVMVEDGWIMKYYFKYYTNASVISSDEAEYGTPAALALQQSVRERGGKIFLYTKDGLQEQQ